MINRLNGILSGARLSPERRERLRENIQANVAGYDPWGVHIGTVERGFAVARWLYQNYFRVEAHGLENLPEGPVMIVPNHSGQIPLDGMFIVIAMLYEAENPRLMRGMIERWFPTVPFIGTLMQRCGQIVGDPENCRRLLRSGQSIMVFPEGARGGGKTYWHRYQLQRFGTGFMRLAMSTKTPIVPTAVIGCEEAFPAIVNVKPLAKLMGAPYFPITPTWPLLGPLGALPIPVKVDLHFGKPITFEDDRLATEEVTHERIEYVKERIRELIEKGLDQRPDLKRFPI